MSRIFGDVYSENYEIRPRWWCHDWRQVHFGLFAVEWGMIYWYNIKEAAVVSFWLMSLDSKARRQCGCEMLLNTVGWSCFVIEDCGTCSKSDSTALWVKKIM